MKALAFLLLLAQQPDGAAFNPPWSAAEVIHAADLAKMPVRKNVYYVGFANLYKSKHVPGAVYGGPGRTAEGLEVLKKAVADVPKEAQIILYCGCCPWDHCPNM